jgi:hypothetical protein
MRKSGIKILQILFVALALLAPMYCVRAVWYLGPKSLQRLAVWPHEALRLVWKDTIVLFSNLPYHAGVMYFLWFLACVWWFRRPKPLSGLVVLATSFLTGTSGLFILWVLGGAKVGHP